MSTVRLQLSLKAKKLKNMAGYMNTSDPYAVVNILGDNPENEPRCLGETEVVYNNLSPNWVELFIINDYVFGLPLYFEVCIYDLNQRQPSLSREPPSGRNGSSSSLSSSTTNGSSSISQHKCMGTALFEVSEIVGSRGNVKSKALQKSGAVYAHIERSAAGGANGSLLFQIRGLRLANTQSDMLSRKSSPFFEINRREERPSGAVWNNIYRSRAIPSNLNPLWDEDVVDLERFCNNDLNRSIRVVVFDHRRSGKHKFMGEFETSVSSFVSSAVRGGNASTENAFTLRNRSNKHVGQVVVVKAQVGDGTNSSQTTLREMQGEAEAATQAVARMSLAPRRPNFVDYLSGGCEISLSVAIDFTNSNGDPRVQTSPHFVSQESLQYPDRCYNDYELAIYSVGSILAKFDSDQRFPIWGFGVKVGNKVHHCFQCGPNAEVDGVHGMIDAYRSVFRRELIMSAPCVLTDVITAAAADAQRKQDLAQHQGRQSYSVLLILTVGNVSQLDRTKLVLNEASKAPLSVVIVGIGEADFNPMKFLDDHQDHEPGRDITKFVKFNDHKSNTHSLTRAVLEEIPDQLVEYFYDEKQIQPNVAETCTEGSVPVQQADDDHRERRRVSYSRRR